MTFPEWFDGEWRQDTDRGKESRQSALVRLCASTGLSLPTVRAALKGEAVGAKTALRLSQATGEQVVPWSLCQPEAEA